MPLSLPPLDGMVLGGGGVERQGVKHDRVKKGGFNLKCTRICFILCNFVFIAVEEFYVTAAIKSRHWRSFPLNVSRPSVLYQHFIKHYVHICKPTLTHIVDNSANYGLLLKVVSHRGLSPST